MSRFDTMTERRHRALIVADVRAFDPSVKVGKARLNIMSGWKLNDDRWMEWSYTDDRHGTTKVEGYYHSAHGAHLAGWMEFLAQQMTPAQYDAYQEGVPSGWMHRAQRLAA